MAAASFSPQLPEHHTVWFAELFELPNNFDSPLY